MKISNLIRILENIKESEGDLTVYASSLEWGVESISDPMPYLSEGGTEVYPYPGLYLN